MNPPAEKAGATWRPARAGMQVPVTGLFAQCQHGKPDKSQVAEVPQSSE